MPRRDRLSLGLGRRPRRRGTTLVLSAGALALTALLAGACKDDKDAEVQRAIADHSTILCDHLFSCCTPVELAQLAFVDDQSPPTHDGCVAFHTKNGQTYIADTNAEEGAGRVAIHVEQSGPCADETRALNCSDFHARLVKIHLADAFALCNPAIVEPTVDNGAPCKLYLDCKSGYCESPPAAAAAADGGAPVLGTCKPLPTLAARCPGASCADGLRCDPTTSTCMKLGGTAAPCKADDECTSGACTDGKCVSPGRCGG